MEREETTLDEVVHRIREGTFYDDYDWASGPALRALNKALAALRGLFDCFWDEDFPTREAAIAAGRAKAVEMGQPDAELREY